MRWVERREGEREGERDRQKDTKRERERGGGGQLVSDACGDS